MIISAHELKHPDPIIIHENLFLEPQLDYSGKMAKDAYRYNRYFINRNRIYAGILDFKIIMKGVRMEHEVLIEKVIGELPLEAFRAIHSGNDPYLIDELTDEQLYIACTIQAGFIEQELNWGMEDWQLWTYFGNPKANDILLRAAAPRDFQTVYIERCYHEMTKARKDAQKIVHETILSQYLKTTKETKNRIILPPLDRKSKMIKDEFRSFMPSQLYGSVTEKWINKHKKRINALCVKKGPNPNHPSQKNR